MILEKGCFYTEADTIVMLHGTNDIVYDKNIEEIVDSIQANIDYIKRFNPDSSIFFLKCLHVNGRLDRSNAKINMLNLAFEERLNNVSLVDTSVFDDEFGNLKAEYTKDGLHLSQEGYAVMKKLIWEMIEGWIE